MADNLKSVAIAAGLSGKDLKTIESLNKAQKVHRELSNLPQKAAQEKFASLTPAQQNDLKNRYGTEDPVTKPNRGWLGTAWHYTGGAFASGVGKTLAGLQNVSDLSTRLYRTIAISQPTFLGGEGLSLTDAWDRANDKGDKVFNNNRLEEARKKYGAAQVNVAMKLAAGQDIGKIIKEATPDEQQYLRLAQFTQGTKMGQNQQEVSADQQIFDDALAEVQAAKYSPGRQFANFIDKITPGDLVKNGFAYRAISGSLDAAYRIFADPILAAGKAKRLVDVSRYALDVVIGGGKVDQYFANANNSAFWNKYGGYLNDLRKAVKEGDTAQAVAVNNQLKILAPELGPAVVKTFLDNGIQDSLTAKAFFANTKDVGDMLKGQIGRRRVLLPTLNTARKTRVALLTTANRVFDLDRVGPELVDNLFFGAAATDDGIAQTLINGKETIVNQLKADANAKNAFRFSSAVILKRIDGFKKRFTPIPYAAMEGLDVLATDANTQIYRLSRLIMPQRESKLIAQAFDAADEGTRKAMYSSIWGTIADYRGINVSQAGQKVERLATGKEKPVFSLNVNGRNPSVPTQTDESIALIESDLSSWVSAPSLRDVDRLSARSGIIQRIMGFSHTEFVEKMTSAWVFLTLAGPRYALRNATEDLMVNLAIGKNPWGIPVAKHLSTRFRTATQLPKGLTKYEKVVENPLGAIMRIVNKNESQKYAARLKQIQESGGDVEEIRTVFAEALTEGKMNRFYKAVGLGKVVERDAALLAKQIKYGDINNALEDVVEGGKNLNTGIDFTSRAVNMQKSTGARIVALEVDIPKNIKRAKGESYGRLAPMTDEATKTAWLLRLGYYANDRIGSIALANVDDKDRAVNAVLDYLTSNPQVASRFRWKDFDVDARGHAERVWESARQLVIRGENFDDVNLELLNKIRTLDKTTGQYRISGSLTIDDLPINEADAPAYIVGPRLVAVSDSGNYTASIMELGYKWLGEANARMSREPIVFYNMIQMRKELEDSGFEKAFIEAHTRGVSAENRAEAVDFAERKLAEIVEDRARLQTLAYVDNPMVQSQFAWSIRNFARFYRASEDFARRFLRVVKYNPEAFVKLSLTYDGIIHSGWIQEDDKGEAYFVYPGMTETYRAVQTAMTGLGIPAEFKVPFPVEFGAKVKMLTPSLDPNSWMPTFAGPLSSVSVRVISNVTGIFSPGSADTINRIFLGPYAEDQPMVSAFLPAHVNRIYAALNQDEREGQYASAFRKAVTYLESSGHGLKQRFTTDEYGNQIAIPFTPQELEEYRVRVKNTTLGVLGLRVVFGFFAPASPQVQLRSDMNEWVRDNGKANFKQVWYSMLDQYKGNYDEAFKKWVELYPDQIPFTVSESERDTVAYFRYAEQSGSFVDNNEQLFKEHKQGAAFLIPHKDGYSWDAYKTMTDMGLRRNKAVSDFLREVQSAADIQEYYSRRADYEDNLANAGTDFERRQLREEFNEWATVFKAGRPLVQEELSQGGERAVQRVNALNDLREMLKKPLTYKASPVVASKLKEMLDVYDKYKDNVQAMQAFSGSDFLAQVEKEEAIAKLIKLSEFNENTRSAYVVLFSRLLGV